MAMERCRLLRNKERERDQNNNSNSNNSNNNSSSSSSSNSEVNHFMTDVESEPDTDTTPYNDSTINGLNLKKKSIFSRSPLKMFKKLTGWGGSETTVEDEIRNETETETESNKSNDSINNTTINTTINHNQNKPKIRTSRRLFIEEHKLRSKNSYSWWLYYFISDFCSAHFDGLLVTIHSPYPLSDYGN